MTTQKAAWKGFELLDRGSVLVTEDGTSDDLDPDLTAALLASMDAGSPAGVREFLTEVLADVGIADMEDLGGEQLSEIVQGILD